MAFLPNPLFLYSLYSCFLRVFTLGSFCTQFLPKGARAPQKEVSMTKKVAKKFNESAFRIQTIVTILESRRYPISISELYRQIMEYDTPLLPCGFKATDRTIRRDIEQLEMTGEELGYYIDRSKDGITLESKSAKAAITPKPVEVTEPTISYVTKKASLVDTDTYGLDAIITTLITNGAEGQAAMLQAILADATDYTPSRKIEEALGFETEEFLAAYHSNAPITFSSDNGKTMNQGYIYATNTTKGRYTARIGTPTSSKTYDVSSLSHIEQIDHFTIDEVIPFPEPQAPQAA